MLEQQRLDSYGCCGKMKVTKAINILGWIGIIISGLFIIGGILLAVYLNLIIPGVVIILVSLILLIFNIILIKHFRCYPNNPIPAPDGGSSARDLGKCNHSKNLINF